MRGAREGIVLLALGALAGCGDVAEPVPPPIALPATAPRVVLEAPGALPAPGRLDPHVGGELAVRAPADAFHDQVVWLQLEDGTGPLEAAAARWTQTGGPEVTVHDAEATTAWFHAPVTAEETELTFDVEVDLGEGFLGGAEVSILIHEGDASIDGPPGDESGAGMGGGPPPEPAPVRDIVVFTADKDLDERSELYASKLDGSDVVRLNAPLPPNTDVSNNFRISPDGRHVAYVTFVTGSVRLFVAQTDGSRVTEVLVPGGVPDSTLADAPWAPDSSRFALGSSDGRVFTARADGSRVTQISVDPVSGGFARLSSMAWAPNGSRIAYLADHNVDNVLELFLARPTRRDVRRLSGPMTRGGDALAFRWSPRSDRVAYWADEISDNAFQLFSAPVAGAPRVPLSGTPFGSGFASFIGWSPDGGRVLYFGIHASSERELFTTASDGTENVRVARDTGMGGLLTPIWTPSSESIVYARTGTTPEGDGLYLTGALGEGTRRLFAEPAGFTRLGTPRLSPDGQYIAAGYSNVTTSDRSIWVVRLEDAMATEVTGDAVSLGVLAWHPDSTHLAYAASFVSGGDFELRTYRVADGAHPVVSDGPVNPLRFFFTEDGAQLVYLDQRSVPVFTNRVFVTTPDAVDPVRDVTGFLTAGGSVFTFTVP